MPKERIHLEPGLVILAGLPLSGKTELGQAVASHTDAEFFDIDKTRHEIAPSNSWLGPEKEKEVMLASYERNHQKAAEMLDIGKTVILAATYSRESYHKMARDLANAKGVSLKFFLLTIPEQEVEKRIQLRQRTGADSNVTNLQSYSEVRDRFIAPPEAEIIEGILPIDKNMQLIITKLTAQ